jgi:hypothetical protein
LRAKVLSGGLIAVVLLVWGVGTAVALRGTWSSIHRPARHALDGSGPSLAAVDRALTAAEPFIDGLYAPREDGTAVVSEYYGLPVRARFDGRPTWQLLGSGRNRIRRSTSTPAVEVGFATFRDGDAEVTGVLGVDWRATARGAAVLFTPLSLTGSGGVALALQGRRLMHVDPDDVGRRLEAVVPLSDRTLFRSHRFTIRHATNDGEQYALYRGQRERARRLGAAARAGGFRAGQDVYAAMWDASRSWPDDLQFTPQAYADCHEPLPEDSYGYEYRSKTCSLPARTYLLLSSFDPLARMLQGLHVLERHGDPGRAYRDRDHLRVTVRGEISRWEQLFRRQGGMPRCSPLGCDETWSSGVRTSVFGALETELGYVQGDAVSRSYADRAATVVLSSQTAPRGDFRTVDGPFDQPLQAGGFAISWRRGMVLGFSSKFVAQKQDDVVADLAMPKEYDGFVPSNAETSMAAYAFLVRYRCRRFGIGCTAQFGRPVEVARR